MGAEALPAREFRLDARGSYARRSNEVRGFYIARAVNHLNNLFRWATIPLFVYGIFATLLQFYGVVIGDLIQNIPWLWNSGGYAALSKVLAGTLPMLGIFDAGITLLLIATAMRLAANMVDRLPGPVIAGEIGLSRTQLRKTFRKIAFLGSHRQVERRTGRHYEDYIHLYTANERGKIYAAIPRIARTRHNLGHELGHGIEYYNDGDTGGTLGRYRGTRLYRRMLWAVARKRPLTFFMINLPDKSDRFGPDELYGDLVEIYLNNPKWLKLWYPEIAAIIRDSINNGYMGKHLKCLP